MTLYRGRTFSIMIEGGLTSALNSQNEMIATDGGSTDGGPLELVRAWVTQDQSEVETMEVCELVRRASGSSASGTVLPEVLHEPGSGIIPGSQVQVSSGGTNTLGPALYRKSWNTLHGWYWQSTPEDRICVEPGSVTGTGLILRFSRDVITDFTYSCGMTLRTLYVDL